MYCEEKPPPQDAATKVTFSVTLDQLPSVLFCPTFLASLAAVMDEGVDTNQLGVSKVSYGPLRMDLWCYEDAQFVPGSCAKGIAGFFDLLSTPGSSSFSGKLAKQYVVRSGSNEEGVEFSNWRVRYQIPLWAPVLLVGGLLLLGAIFIFLLAIFSPKTGVGNVKF